MEQTVTIGDGSGSPPPDYLGQSRALNELKDSLIEAPQDVRADILTKLLRTVMLTPAGNKPTRAMIHQQCQIVAIVDAHTKQLIKPDGTADPEVMSVLAELARVMGHLHASKLGDSFSKGITYLASPKFDSTVGNTNAFKPRLAFRSPQTDACKVLKRRQEALLSSPCSEEAATLVGDIWKGDTVKSLSTNLRTFSDKDMERIAVSATATLVGYGASRLLGGAISGAIHLSTHVADVLHAAQDHLTGLHQTSDAQAQLIQQYTSEANTSLGAVQPGSETCDLLWSPLHSNGGTSVLPSDPLYQVTPANAPAVASALDGIDLTSASEPTKTAISVAREKVHAIVETMKLQNATLADINATQSQIPGMQTATDSATATAAQTHENIAWSAMPVIAEGAALAGTAALAGKSKSSEAQASNNPTRRSFFGRAYDYAKENITFGVGKSLYAASNRERKLSSNQHAVIRGTLSTLKQLREKSTPHLAPEAKRDLLKGKWAAVMQQLAITDPAGDAPPLAATEKAEILHACIKELDPKNFGGVDMRGEVIGHVGAEAMLEILPHLVNAPLRNAISTKWSSHPVSYVWLADYLHAEHGDALSTANRATIAATLNKIAAPLGAAQRLQMKAQALKVKNALMPAAVRLDLGVAILPMAAAVKNVNPRATVRSNPLAVFRQQKEMRKQETEKIKNDRKDRVAHLKSKSGTLATSVKLSKASFNPGPVDD